ncbi:hypothetical protein SAMN04515647_4065 [Cohaesibacter sp. ES.047]|nr:hypothetical protein SAMN04515647_4065 [Cohaesibacter sp. ES.047]
MVDPSLLVADCNNCAALCCVSLAFDRSDDFPIEKPNGVPCPQLGERNQCKIYETREQEGYRGCCHYDCHGAGQRVTQEVFKGRSWRTEPQLLGDMTSAFVIMLRVHGLLELLQAASQLPLTDEEQVVYDGLLVDLNPVDGWSEDKLEAFEGQGTEKRVRAFLMSLRHHVA